ncbi:MAG TPA: hypothetical protein ENK57_03455, partial [Polyangiaceae bacterium]|nr:hypothetical protein [Polyangiaceae bacterium]
MRTHLSLLLFVLLAGCSLIVGPGSKYLDGSPGTRDAGPDAQLPDGQIGTPDGGDAGPPVEPLAPIGSGVGLSDYTPRPGDALEAYVGPFFDPNGDAVSVQYEWQLNGSPLTGEAGSSLIIPPAAAGMDEYSLEVTLTDGTLSTTLRAGPAVVHDDTDLRWELLLPLRGGAAGFTTGIFDATHKRLIFFGAEDDVGLWEAQLTGDGGPPRWVHLESVSGALPRGERTVFPDPQRDRLLFFGNNLVALDMDTPQGGERWTAIGTRGDAPTPRSAPAHLRFRMPDGEEVIFVYGGLDGDAMPIDEAYLLHMEDEDRWERLSVALPPTPVTLPELFFHTATQRVFLVGGASMTGGTEVYAWDLDDAREAGFVLVDGLSLPHPVFGGGAAVDPDDENQITLFGGGRRFDGDMVIANDDVVRIDLDTRTVGSSPAVSPPPAGPVFATAAGDGDGYVAFHKDFDFRGLSFYRFDPAAGSFTVISAPNHDLPPPLMQGQAIVDERGFVLSHGRTSLGEEQGSPATLAYRNGRFSMLRLSGDAPEARWGAVADNSYLPNPAIHWFSGGHPPGAFTSSVWRLRASSWQEFTVRTGESIPEERQGHVLIHGVCGGGGRGNVLGLVGGRTPAGNILDDQWMSECGSTGDDCTWFSTRSAGRPGTVWSAVTHLHGPGGTGDSRHAFISYGRGESGLRSDVHIIDTCDDSTVSQTWTVATIAGAVPPPRMGHSTSGIMSDDETQTVAYWLFGGADESGGGTLGDIYEMRWDGDVSSPTVTFTAVTAAGPAPTPRMFHQVAYDRERHRLLVYGG